MGRRDVEVFLNKYPKFREKLYARGYLLTSVSKMEDSGYPFYGQWKKLRVYNSMLYISPQQNQYVFQGKDAAVVLVGHVYNPFTMESEENLILERLYTEWRKSKEDLLEYVNQFTGVFTLFLITADRVVVVGDATGMQATFYTYNKKDYYVSSHENLIGDLLHLKRSEYVDRLSKYKFFPLLGNSLPGDLTQFESLKRLVPNHFISFKDGKWTSERFYWPVGKSMSKEEIVESCADILNKNLELIGRKWKKPAISLTGGCDSKTTLACANGLYNQFTYFSYCSSEAEEVDAVAAEKICNVLGISHYTYMIPENDEDIEDVEAVRLLLDWNTGDLRKNNENDVRKRALFADCKDFDVEVKSWVSEAGRAYYSKRFNG